MMFDDDEIPDEWELEEGREADDEEEGGEDD